MAEETLNRALPQHIAIIMDGNGRWAKKRGLARTEGHAEGSETFRRVATWCSEAGIRYLTVYAFSTENWKRPPEEVGVIMRLLKKYLREAIESLRKDNISLYFFGDQSRLDPEIRALIQKTDEISKTTTGLKVGICLNYGGRDEIVRAARRLSAEVAAGTVSPENIDERCFSEHLDTAAFPDPDLIIRPGGEMRLSNFLLWQSAYAEFYFTDTLWPDFGEKELKKAIASYQGRFRRFGGTETK